MLIINQSVAYLLPHLEISIIINKAINISLSQCENTILCFCQYNNRYRKQGWQKSVEKKGEIMTQLTINDGLIIIHLLYWQKKEEKKRL